MINVANEVRAFNPIDLAGIPEEYRPVTEQKKTAFILYNKALHEVDIGHEDIAKNYLRKAVTIFPDFYDAIMVLGILIFANGDRIGAVRIFNSVKNVDKRAISIGILDHLVEEAEKPSGAHAMQSKSVYDSALGGKAESVMGVEHSYSSSSQDNRAKYSRQIFEKNGGYYEPQRSHARPDTQTRNYYNQRRNSVRTDESDNNIKHNKTNNRNVEGAVNTDVKSMFLLNKYLIGIVALLIMFSIIISTILINRTTELNKLRSQLESMPTIPPTSAAAEDSTAEPTEAGLPDQSPE